MNKRQVERYRKLLVAKQTELLHRVREARTSEQEGAGKVAPDLGDRARSTVIRDLSYQLTAGERELLRRIDEAGIELSDFRLRRPTLDDVFLELTGTPAAQPSADDPQVTP